MKKFLFLLVLAAIAAAAYGALTDDGRRRTEQLKATARQGSDGTLDLTKDAVDTATSVASEAADDAAQAATDAADAATDAVQG